MDKSVTTVLGVVEKRSLEWFIVGCSRIKLERLRDLFRWNNVDLPNYAGGAGMAGCCLERNAILCGRVKRRRNTLCHFS